MQKFADLVMIPSSCRVESVDESVFYFSPYKAN